MAGKHARPWQEADTHGDIYRPLALAPGVPTQVAHPWRATIRTVIQAAIALAALAPFLIDAIGLDQTLPIVASILAVAAAITRIAALPQVNQFVERFVPWLATGVHTEHEEH